MVDAIDRVPIKRRLITIEEYDRMGRAGILTEDERVELIGGELVQMAAVGGPHVTCILRCDDLFHARLAGRATVSVQNPIRLPPRTEPLPDIVLLRRREDYYAGVVPNAGDVLLLIEVSDTTLAYDRRVKLPLYAAADIPEVWIVDLPRRRIFVHRRPAGRTYAEITIVAQGTLFPLAFPDLEIRLDEILG